MVKTVVAQCCSNPNGIKVHLVPIPSLTLCTRAARRLLWLGNVWFSSCRWFPLTFALGTSPNVSIKRQISKLINGSAAAAS